MQVLNTFQATHIMRNSSREDHEMEDLVRREEIVKSTRRVAFWYPVRAVTITDDLVLG